MQSVLVMFRSDGERRSFSLARDITVIGRREDCDLRIPLGDVSRKHCRLIHDGESFRLEDLGSSNGTYHNGQRVQEATLSPGDSIQVGPVVFVLQIDGVPADDELAPMPVQAAPTAAEGEVEAPVAEEDAALQTEVPAEEAAYDAPTEIVEPEEDDDDGFDMLLDEVLHSNDKPRSSKR